MKIQGLIRKLETIKRKHGNLDVCVMDPTALCLEGILNPTPAFIGINTDAREKPDAVFLCDELTAESCYS